ncbi:MAG: tape measure protein, partial [Bacillota bacterium]
MATVASFNVALVASTGRFVSAVSRAERQWNQFARSIQRQAKTLPESIRSAVPASLVLGRNIVKIGAVAGAAFAGMAAWGVRLAAQWEQAQIAFTTLLGSAEEANKFLGQLVEFAARTPFNLTNITQASRQLLAYGFAAEQVLPTLSAIGDAVAALGGGADEIQRAVLAIGQMRAKGKVAGEEMRQLTELGIPAGEMLAESIGVSVPEAMELVEKRAIDASRGIAAVLEGINRRFAGAMEVQSRTLLGRLSTLRDNVEIILRGLGQDILRLTRLGERIDRLTQAVSRFAAVVAEHGFIGALARAFPPWVQTVIVGITGAIVGGLVPAIIAWLIPALKKLGISLWATLRPLLPWMAAGAAVAVTAYLLARAWGHLADVARAVWSAIGAVALYGASLVVLGVGLILAGIGAIVPAFRGAAQAVLGLADSLKASASQSWASARSAAQMVRTAQQAQAGQEGVAKAGQKAAESQNQLAEGVEKAAQAAAANIQSFDEVHQLQEEMAESPAATMPEMPAYELG